jgi:WD40 repeat protein
VICCSVTYLVDFKMTATSVFASLGSRERVGSSSYKVRKSTLGSSYIAERFDRDPIILEGHSGCVNSILFTDCGSQIITGADDRSIRFWDLEGEMVNHMPTIHTNNVFFAKDLPATGCNDIVSCAADGRVVLSNVVQSEVLASFT